MVVDGRHRRRQHDSRVANHLLQTVSAARLMGALVIVTGVSSEVAQSLVALGIELTKVNTVGDLQGASRRRAAPRLFGWFRPAGSCAVELGESVPVPSSSRRCAHCFHPGGADDHDLLTCATSWQTGSGGCAPTA